MYVLCVMFKCLQVFWKLNAGGDIIWTELHRYLFTFDTKHDLFWGMWWLDLPIFFFRFFSIDHCLKLVCATTVTFVCGTLCVFYVRCVVIYCWIFMAVWLSYFSRVCVCFMATGTFLCGYFACKFFCWKCILISFVAVWVVI